MNHPTSSSATTPTDGSPPLLHTIQEACVQLRISRWTLYRLIHDRQLATVKIGARRFVAPTDIQALIDSLRTEID
jgi:excisionase family DNA binding protein